MSRCANALHALIGSIEKKKDFNREECIEWQFKENEAQNFVFS